MRKSFMKRAVAVVLSAAIIVSMPFAKNITAVSAVPKYVGLKTKFKTLKAGDIYNLRLQNNTLNWKIQKAVSNDTSICQVTNKTKYVKITAKNKGRASVWVTLKTTQKPAGRKDTKRLKCRVNVKSADASKPADPMEPISSSEPTSSSQPVVDTAKTVATQSELDEALSNASFTNITIKSGEEDLVIKAGEYRNVNLIVDAPNSEVVNNGIFKSISIKAIKDNTWTEKVSGNSIKVEALKASIILEDRTVLSNISCTKPGADIKLIIKGSGRVEAVSLDAKLKLTIHGDSAVQVPVIINAQAKDAELVTDLSAAVTTSIDASIVFQKGAENSTVQISNAAAVVKVQNNSTAPITVTKANNSTQNVIAGMVVTFKPVSDNTSSGNFTGGGYYPNGGYHPGSGTNPGTSEPSSSEPVNSEPSSSEPENSEPSSSEPVNSEPSSSEPENSEPSGSEPGSSEPENSEPSSSEPANSEPSSSEPANSEPSSSEPANSGPSSSEPVNSEPSGSESGSSEPVNSEPSSSEPVNSEPDSSEPSSSEPVNSEPSSSEPGSSGSFVGNTPVKVHNDLGDIILEQSKVNETGLTIKIENVDNILKEGNADKVKITAKMYYNDIATQEVTEIIPLENNKPEYFVDLNNFGKFTVDVEYVKNEETLSPSEPVIVGIASESYNLAPISATFPALLFSLSIWEGSDYCITKRADGTYIPTITVFERADSWNWGNLPEHVYKLPTASEEDFTGVTWGGQKWLDCRNKMSAYIKDLYEISPNAEFNLYYTDNYVENMLMLLVANQIPESQYHVVLLSDGSGTYSYFKEAFQNDTDGSLYNAMRKDWENLKEQTRKEGKFDPSKAAYRDSVNLKNTCLPKYAAVAAEDENVEWWVNRARTTDTFNISNTELSEKVVGNCTERNASKMLQSLSDADKADDFKNLYHFDNEMFHQAGEEGKQVMLILGTTVGNENSEGNFSSYAKLVMDYYGDGYVYYYKGHPGTPTILYPSKQNQLNELGIIDVDSSIPAELILFFYPDLSLCGYNSTTFQSVQSAQMACGMFNMTKENGLAEPYGQLLDFFTYRINKDHTTYGSYCLEDSHAYFVLEFNDTADHEFGIYDAQLQTFTYPENTEETLDPAA